MLSWNLYLRSSSCSLPTPTLPQNKFFLSLWHPLVTWGQFASSPVPPPHANVPFSWLKPPISAAAPSMIWSGLIWSPSSSSMPFSHPRPRVRSLYHTCKNRGFSETLVPPCLERTVSTHTARDQLLLSLLALHSSGPFTWISQLSRL